MKFKGLVLVLALLLGLCVCQAALATPSVVTNEGELQTAIASGVEIEVAADISLTSSITLTNAMAINLGCTITVPTGVTIDGDNKAHTITTSGTANAFVLNGGTLRDIKIVNTNPGNSGTQQYIVSVRSNAKVQNCDFSGNYTSGDNSIVVAMIVGGTKGVSVTGWEISGNTIDKLRQPAYIYSYDGDTCSGTVSGNTVTGTRGFVVSANSQVDFTGNNLDSSNYLGIAIIRQAGDPDTAPSAYTNLAALSAANPGAYIQDQVDKVSASNGEYIVSSTGYKGEPNVYTQLGSALADATSGSITLFFPAAYTASTPVNIPSGTTLKLGAGSVDLGASTIPNGATVTVISAGGALIFDNTTIVSGATSGTTLVGNGSSQPTVLSPSTPSTPTTPALTLSPSALELVVGGATGKLTASEAGVTWSTSDPSIAIVDANGAVRGIAAGTATITATLSDDRTASCTATVKLPEEKGDGEEGSGSTNQLDIGIEVLALRNGKTAILPVLKGYQGHWTVSNPAIAKLTNNGKRLRALSKGTTILTYTCTGVTGAKAATVGDRPLYEGAQYKIEVNVRKKAELPTKITLSRYKKTLKVGQSYQIQSKVRPAAALDKKVFYTSLNKDIAIVNKAGLITALKPGKVKIRVYTANLKYKTITVTVKK